MATPGCIAKIKEHYTGFGPCTDPYCEDISFGIGVHCSQAKPPLKPDDPVGPQKDPNLNGPGKPGYCYCCCSCFGSGTPIEVNPGEYAPARDIVAHELIQVAGAELRWRRGVVEIASTWDNDDGIVPSMYLLRYGWDDGFREVVVSPDHPFLMEDGTLVSVQDLTKLPLQLRRADGGLSAVLVVAQGSYVGGVSSIQMEGEFDGTDLSGHLLNTYGLVSGDFKVQVHYASQHLATALVHDFSPEQENLPAGTPEYQRAFPSDAYAEFVADSSAWPEGFVPVTQAELTVPVTAARYFTDDQADYLRRHAPMTGAGDTYPARNLLYLFNLCRGLYPGIDFLLDWNVAKPNAYTWSEWGRRTVVFTGGLVRLKDLGRDGLGIVLAAMLSYQYPDVRCVGEADYTAIARVLHEIWDGNLFVTVIDAGMTQLEKVMSLLEHAEPGAGDNCKDPGIACRLDCYAAGLSRFGVPDCAKPKPAYIEVRDARAISPDRVQLTFSRDLDIAVAELTENYEFEPATDVVTASVNPDLANLVVLEVSELTPSTTYLVKVSNVMSNDGVHLDPRHNTGAFTTKK